MIQITLRHFYFGSETIDVEVPLYGASRLQTPCGFYDDLAYARVGLFAFEQKSYLYLNGAAIDIRGQQVTASHQRGEGDHRRLELTISGTAVPIPYENPRVPVGTWAYTESEEDVDLGLWLAAVLASEERLTHLTKAWS